MDVSLANPFINATVSVLEIMAKVTCHAEKPYLKKDAVGRGDVTGIIGLSGIAKGSISVTFDEKSILKIVSNLLGEKIEMINEEIRDAVGEITNMISGQARKELSEKGKVFKAAIPTIITGKNHEIRHMSNSPIIAIPFRTEDGRFMIEICIEETRDKHS
ncbi:MAG: chemotaxis protein CheX [Proteobacteria bacterium]|nr:chemotaxis protein CheX [Pseudomonadota bacterium]